MLKDIIKPLYGKGCFTELECDKYIRQDSLWLCKSTQAATKNSSLFWPILSGMGAFLSLLTENYFAVQYSFLFSKEITDLNSI